MEPCVDFVNNIGDEAEGGRHYDLSRLSRQFVAGITVGQFIWADARLVRISIFQGGERERPRKDVLSLPPFLFWAQ